MATGCGCKEVYRFPHSTYPYSSLQRHPIPTFCSFKKCFSFLFQYFFVYILCIKYFFTQYKHAYGKLRASHGSHMKAAHTVLYMKHTQTHASYPAMDISCMSVVKSRSRRRALYRDASRAGRLCTGPASFRGHRSRTRRRSQCMPRRVRVYTYTSPETPTYILGGPCNDLPHGRISHDTT